MGKKKRGALGPVGMILVILVILALLLSRVFTG